MPHGRHHGNLRRIDRACNDLLVKAPEVFQAATAARQDDHIHLAPRVEFLDSPGDLFGRPLPLHAHGVDDDVGPRKTPFENLKDIADDRARRRRDDADRPRQKRQGFFARFVEQPLLGEPGLQLFESHLQCARALGLEGIDIKLVLAVAAVDADAAGGDHLHTVRKSEFQARARVAEQHTAQSALRVLQAEIAMARSGRAQIGNLAFHPDVLEDILQDLF